jgi:hypothetical protein
MDLVFLSNIRIVQILNGYRLKICEFGLRLWIRRRKQGNKKRNYLKIKSITLYNSDPAGIIRKLMIP